MDLVISFTRYDHRKKIKMFILHYYELMGIRKKFLNKHIDLQNIRKDMASIRRFEIFLQYT